jgi:hypothetical protein
MAQDKIQVRLVGGPMDLDDTVVEWTWKSMRLCIADETGVCRYYTPQQDAEGNWKGTYDGR